MDTVDYLEGCLINAFYVNTEIHEDLFNIQTFCIKDLLKELKNLGYWIFSENFYKDVTLLYVAGERVYPVKEEETDDIIYYFDKDGWSKDSVKGYVSFGKKEIIKE